MVRLPIGAIVAAVAAAAIWVRFLRRPTRRQRALALIATLVGAVIVLVWPLTAVSVYTADAQHVDDATAEKVLAGLLTNVYRAFDYRSESAIYDVLARSVSGELLTQVYLDTRRALEVQSQGGVRVTVAGVDMIEAGALMPFDGDGFQSRCSWLVTGKVGHWGHVHQRVNQYEAQLTIQPVDGVWKITGLTLLDEQRM